METKLRAPLIKLKPQPAYSIVPIEGFAFPESIEFIYQISDVHVRPLERHQEFRNVFETLYQQLNTDSDRQRGIICITGDLVDAKLNISNELIILVTNFLMRLSAIMPIILIAGNHDLNITQKNRLDTLLGILFQGEWNTETQSQLDHLGYLPHSHCRVPNLVYIRKSGAYAVAGKVFGVSSFLDGKIVRATEIGLKEVQKIGLGDVQKIGLGPVQKIGLGDVQKIGLGPVQKIGLGHLTLYESCNAQGRRMQHGVNLATFNGYDYVFLGDIHQFQLLGKEKRISYSGSLVQCNFGEPVTGHGYFKRSLTTGQYWFCRVLNPIGMLKIEMSRGVHWNRSLDLTGLKQVKVRIYHRREHKETNVITDWLRKQGLEIIYVKKFLESKLGPLIVPETSNSATLVADASEPNASEINVADTSNSPIDDPLDQLIASVLAEAPIHRGATDLYDLNIQLEELSSCLKDNPKNDLKPAEIAQILTWHQHYYKLVETEENRLARSFEWKIDYLKFENIFCYRGPSYLDFSQLRGLVGILGFNGTGKSSIVDIILYTIFDQCDRLGTTNRHDLLNKSSDSGWIEMQITDISEGRQFLFYLQAVRGGINRKKMTAKRLYYQRPNADAAWTLIGGNAEIKAISNLFGSYEVFTTVYVKLQSNEGTMDGSSGSQHKLIQRLLKLDCFEQISELAAEEISNKRKLIRLLTQTISDADDTETEQKALEATIAELAQALDLQENAIGVQRNIIEQLYQKYGGQINHLKEFKDLEQHCRGLTDKDLAHYQEDVKNYTDSKAMADTNIPIRQKRLAVLEQNKSTYQTKLRELKLEAKKENLVTSTVTSSNSEVPVRAPAVPAGALGSVDILVSYEQFINMRATVAKQRNLKFDHQCQCCRHNRQILGDTQHYAELIQRLINKYQDANKQNETEIALIRQQLEKDAGAIKKFQEASDRLVRLKRYLDLSAIVDPNLEIHIINNAKSALNQREQTYKKALEAIRQRREQLILLRERRDKHLQNKVQLKSLETDLDLYLKYHIAIGPKGLLCNWVDQKIDFLTELVNDIVQSLVDHYSIKIQYSDKGFEILLAKQNEYFHYKILGGFEKFLVNISLKLALASISNVSKPNWVLIDEGFGSADTQNRANFGMFLENLERRYETILVISHIPEMMELLEDNRIHIEVLETGSRAFTNDLRAPIDALGDNRTPVDALSGNRASAGALTSNRASAGALTSNRVKPVQRVIEPIEIIRTTRIDIVDKLGVQAHNTLEKNKCTSVPNETNEIDDEIPVKAPAPMLAKKQPIRASSSKTIVVEVEK